MCAKGPRGSQRLSTLKPSGRSKRTGGIEFGPNPAAGCRLLQASLRSAATCSGLVHPSTGLCRNTSLRTFKASH